MIIAYLFPSDAPDPRDGLGFITVAPNRERAIENLKEQFGANYADYETAKIEWVTDDPKQRPHVTVEFIQDGGSYDELYWLHFAEEQ